MNVTLPARTPVNLYAATGFTVGTVIISSNVTGGDVRLSDSEAGLTSNCTMIGKYESASNKDTDLEAWAMCLTDCEINVKEA